MTPQEQQLIDGLIQRIRSTPATDKDDEADRYLHQQLDPVPDVLYVLAQTALVQQYGLQNAQQQLAATQQQLQALKLELDKARSSATQQPEPVQRSGSFLGHLFGTDAAPSQPAPQQGYQPVTTGTAPPPVYGQPGYGQPAYPQPGYPQSGYPLPGYAPAGYGQPVVMQSPGFGGGAFGGGPFGGGGFLRGALQTAAGVAAGEMVFQGMEDMFRGFGHENHGYDRPTEVINNNYYDDDRRDSGHEHREAGGDDSSFYNAANDASRQDLSPDIEDRRGFTSGSDLQDSGGGEGFFGSSDGDAGDSGGYDDSSSDDSASFDDGGGSDDDSSN